MPVQVEYITLGDASKRLGVPAPTLRLWTDHLEEYEVHYVKRNDRNERLYHDNDLEIFAYLRDLKSEHGRKATTKDLAYMIFKLGSEDEAFTLRTKEEAPRPEPTNQALELLNHDDVKKLLESDKTQQFIDIIVNNTTKNLKDELINAVGLAMHAIKEEIKEDVSESSKKTDDLYEKVKVMEEDLKKREERQKEREEQLSKFVEDITNRQKERDEKLTQAMRDMMESKKGFFARLFGK